MTVRNSESRALAVYFLLILALTLVTSYVILCFLPISFYILPCFRTQKNQHYNSHQHPTHSNFIPHTISMRGPPPLILL
jgi:hypothetical protein